MRRPTAGAAAAGGGPGLRRVGAGPPPSAGLKEMLLLERAASTTGQGAGGKRLRVPRSVPAATEAEGEGPPELSAPLERALQLHWRHGHGQVPRGFRRLTHGFHPYPAGLQAATVAELLAADGLLPGASVLDPFVGGGTVLVEGMRAGRATFGRDLSPLAEFCATYRTWRPGPAALAELTARAAAVGALLEAEDVAGRSARERWGVLQAGIISETADHPALASPLLFCLSAVLQRSGKRRSRGRHGRRGRGQRPQRPQQLFTAAVADYVVRVEELQDATAGAPDPDIARQDARAFSVPEPVDAVVTSPPYPAVYDYLSSARSARHFTADVSVGHSELAFDSVAVPSGRDWSRDWDSGGEIGSKQSLKKAPRDFDATWQADQEKWLGRVHAALKPGGRAAINIGDGTNDIVDTKRSVRAAAEGVGMTFLAAATLRSRSKMTEHIVLLEK